jgi:hypothetical protein
MSSVSNKSWNFMIDSKVILHDIFYDTSVNFLCAYPTLYTAGMRDVTYMGVYNTYLHGKCFLSALYKDISCLTLPHSTLLFLSSDSSSHAYATCRLSKLFTKHTHRPTSHFLQKYVQRAPCLLVQRTHATPPLFSFGRPVLWMLYFRSTELGRSWTWSTPWSATSCHIFFVWMDNPFANENFTEIFLCHFAATWLVYKKCV